MIKITDKHLCCGCAACTVACPRQCIMMCSDNEGFSYPYVDEKRCINCGRCEQVCPIKRRKPANNKKVHTYAAYALSESIVSNSSSGGIFSLLANWTIQKEGVVFGAMFDEKWNLQTTYTLTAKGLPPLAKAKYVQSATNKSFYQVKEMLQHDKIVLFCGTPCQVAGLQSYLGKTYENLFCVDFICHGVASPEVWKHYLSLFKREITGVNFRDKRNGWEKNSICITFADGNEFVQPNSENSYMQAFLSGLSMRPSCFNCAFKGLNRSSDLTLGDLWGAEYQCPAGYNFMGTSFVLAHTKKGHYLLDNIRNEIHIVEAPMPESIAFNKSIINSTKEPALREYFIANYHHEGLQFFNESVKKCISSKPDNRYYAFIKAIKSFLSR